MAFQLLALATLGASQVPTNADHVRPSFSCTGRLTRVEAVICADEELSAYDAAMAIFYGHSSRKRSDVSINQSQWLKVRNTCDDRECILAAYQGWINQSWSSPPSMYERTDRKPDGSDLMLGTLQSPTGEVKGLSDSGSLFIQPLGHDWYVFKAFAVFVYDPHDGRGPNVSDSEASGVVRLPNGRGVWTDGTGEGCTVEFRRLNAHTWELADSESCSGLGSTLNGVYSDR